MFICADDTAFMLSVSSRRIISNKVTLNKAKMSWDTGATGGGEEWNSGSAAEPAGGDDFAGGDTNGFNGDAGDGGDGGGNGGGGGFSGTCFNCGGEGHSKAECPEPPKPRPCFNCGEDGHNKADCTNEKVEREFTGTCRLCELPGHRAADCPTAPPKRCNNCQQDGHEAFTCEAPRKLDYSHVEDVPAEKAWEEIQKAVEERDIDDIKEAAQKYFKACPETTYVDMEKGFRAQELGVYLIALEKELAITYTNVDLQGNLEKKYTVNWRLSEKPGRPKEAEGWPATPEENLERLADAGVPVDRGVPKCGNCNLLGHTFRSCPEEKMENADRAVVQCFNCSELGHRVRDCPIPRPDKFACRNCNQSGHGAKECPEPRNPANVTCKVCDQSSSSALDPKGHFAKDCPEEGHGKNECTNERKIVCRNCDAEGHQSRECPKPRDYSRVECSNCKQKGHTKVRCKEPIVEDTDGGAGYGADSGNFGGGETSGDAGFSGGAETGDGSGDAPAASWEGGGETNGG
ncbi:ATP-dependent RNA helicase glh-4, partial [Lachnellula suecica]